MVRTKARPPQRSARVILAFAAVLCTAILIVVGCWPQDTETADEREASADSPRSVLLSLGVSDETETNPPPEDQFAIEVPGHEMWYPNLEFGGTDETFGEYPVGVEEVFYIYPEGPDGRRLEVPFEMQPTMTSGVASSKTRLHVYDDSISVRGPAIPEQQLSFPR